jgi:hypothetical protein
LPKNPSTPPPLGFSTTVHLCIDWTSRTINSLAIF